MDRQFLAGEYSNSFFFKKEHELLIPNPTNPQLSYFLAYGLGDWEIRVDSLPDEEKVLGPTQSHIH